MRNSTEWSAAKLGGDTPSRTKSLFLLKQKKDAYVHGARGSTGQNFASEFALGIANANGIEVEPLAPHTNPTDFQWGGGLGSPSAEGLGLGRARAPYTRRQIFNGGGLGSFAESAGARQCAHRPCQNEENN